ncbi:MAG: ATP-binding protein [Desulfovibrionaceae bacterium]|nr:ATP-binding protein [Desulfovibrionaceae bacterium]
MPEITLSATVQSIPEAMAFLKENLGADYESLGTHVDLAVEELFVNVASYAYKSDAYRQSDRVDTICLGCRWVNMDGHDLFCVWLRDWGAPFDPFRVKKPDTELTLDEREIGGLGVHLVKHVSKHYVYSGADGSNTVELYFQKND